MRKKHQLWKEVGHKYYDDQNTVLLFSWNTNICRMHVQLLWHWTAPVLSTSDRCDMFAALSVMEHCAAEHIQQVQPG